MGLFLIEEDADAAFVGRAGGVAVGRGSAGRGAGIAGGSGGVGCVAARCGADAADRGALARRGDLPRPSDDRDGELCALDGGQAAHGLGIRDVGAGGLGLAASAPLLPDRAWGARAARVDGAQADTEAGRRGDGRAGACGGRQGPARDALQGKGGADRLDGRGGRRSLSDRFGAGARQARGCWRARRASFRGWSAATRAGCGIDRVRSDVVCGR